MMRVALGVTRDGMGIVGDIEVGRTTELFGASPSTVYRSLKALHQPKGLKRADRGEPRSISEQDPAADWGMRPIFRWPRICSILRTTSMCRTIEGWLQWLRLCLNLTNRPEGI